MTDPETDSAEAEPEEEALPSHRIEAARSSRSRCRSCNKKIQKDTLRLGVLLEGPYGTGYLWHHLNCAARRRIDDVQEAYRDSAWDEGLEVPPLEELEKLKEKADERKKEKKELPHVERAKSARSKCKHCGEGIEKDAWRVILGRGVEFGGQTRVGPINVHPACVPEELMAEDCATELEGFEEALRENSNDVSSGELDEVLTEIGELR